MADTVNMLKIRNLKKKFGNYRVLEDMNMEIKAGALYGFVGPNGAGKTTTIRIMSGLLLPDAGEAGAGKREVRICAGSFWRV